MIGVGTGALGQGSVAAFEEEEEEVISALFQSLGPCTRQFALIAVLNARFLLSLQRAGLFIAESVFQSIGLKGSNHDGE